MERYETVIKSSSSTVNETRYKIPQAGEECNLTFYLWKFMVVLSFKSLGNHFHLIYSENVFLPSRTEWYVTIF